MNIYRNKKTFVLLLSALLIVSVIYMTGCSKKHTITVEYDTSVSLELLSADSGVKASAQDNIVIIEAEKNGEYQIMVKTDNGETIAITLVYENGNSAVSDDSELPCKVLSN